MLENIYSGNVENNVSRAFFLFLVKVYGQFRVFLVAMAVQCPRRLNIYAALEESINRSGKRRNNKANEP